MDVRAQKPLNTQNSRAVQLYRRANLIRLLEAFPSKRIFAEKCGMNPSHVSQLCGGQSKMGDTIARTIENKLDLAVGSMDQPPVDMPEDINVEDNSEVNPIDLIEDVIHATPTQINKIAKILGYYQNRRILDQFRRPVRDTHYDVVSAWINKSRLKTESF